MLAEEVDLRPFIRLVWGYRLWLMGLTVVTAVVVYFVASWRPPVYEATALVAITEPWLQIQFDSRLETVQNERQPFAAYPELALSDQVIMMLQAQLDFSMPGVETVGQLRGLLTAVQGNDPSLLRLTVAYSDAERAAQIANLWAAIFLDQVDQLYGLKTPKQVVFFEAQLEEALLDLEEVEEALIAFQSRNRISILNNQLLALNTTQTMLLNTQRAQTLLAGDLHHFREKLLLDNASAPVSLADQLTVLGLQQRVFNVVQEPIVQLQIVDLQGVGEGQRAEQLEQVDGLITVLSEALQANEQLLRELEPEVLILQEQIEEAMSENLRLTQNRDIALETHRSLALKVEEEKITSQSESRGIRIASAAGVPTDESGLGALFMAVIAAAFTVFLAVVGIVVGAWWQNMVVARE